MFCGSSLRARFAKPRYRTANVPEILVREHFTYTAQDRLLTHTHKVDNNPTQVLAVNEYTELGQLKSKQIGGQSTQPRLQKVDYTYNIRGWLTAINDIANLQQAGDPKDLFSFQLAYNNPQTATPLFNGNISETYWRTAGDNNIRKYGYAYDHLNRLTDAIYQRPLSSGQTHVTNSYNEKLTYDSNGNFKTLNRNGMLDNINGSFIEIDNLSYTYMPNTNQLASVYDQ